MRWMPRCLAGALCALAMGCAESRPPAVDFSEATKPYRNEDYQAVFDAWTRHGRLIADFGTVLEVWATFKSWDFRQAYVAKYAKVYELADGERNELAKAQMETARVVYEIHLVAQSTKDRWNDLDRKTSAWRITLLDGTGAELAPTSVRTDKIPEIYENEFFPTHTLFSRTYTLKFVHPEGSGESFTGPESGRMILRIASPIGKVEVVWEAKNSATAGLQ